jgi:hypothetical protein
MAWRDNVIFMALKHDLLSTFVFKLLPPLIHAAHDMIATTPTNGRRLALYKCFEEYARSVEELFGGSRGSSGAVVAYCTTYAKNYGELSEHEPTSFLKARIREDLLQPIRGYALRFWMRFVCDGPPNKKLFGDILENILYPRLLLLDDDPEVRDIKDICDGWVVPDWLVAGDEDAKEATKNWMTEFSGDLAWRLDIWLASELKHGTGAALLHFRAAQVELKDDDKDSRKRKLPRKQPKRSVVLIYSTDLTLTQRKVCSLLDSKGTSVPMSWQRQGQSTWSHALVSSNLKHTVKTYLSKAKKIAASLS